MSDDERMQPMPPQTFNPMWLLNGIHDWLQQAHHLTDEQWAALLRQVEAGPQPRFLEQYRDKPELVLCIMMLEVDRVLKHFAEGRGYSIKPGGGAGGRLDLSTTPPTPLDAQGQPLTKGPGGVLQFPVQPSPDAPDKTE
jgi:hypothetical protein